MTEEERLTPDGWRIERIEGLNGVVRLPSLKIELPMADLYEEVVFPAKQDRN